MLARVQVGRVILGGTDGSGNGKGAWVLISQDTRVFSHYK